MSKRICSGCILICLFFSMSACAAGVDRPVTGSAEKTSNQAAGLAGTPADEWYAGGGKVLVAYFSATGNTRPVAETAAEATGGDLFEIVPAQPYTTADLNYNTDCRANAEQNDPDARPAIASTVENMEQYDAVLIGYPIWWGRAPKIIHTFLETYELSGKTIATFCTSGSSPHEDATLRDYEPNAVWLEGRRFSGTSQVEDWVNGLDLTKSKEDHAVGVFNFDSKTVTLNSGYEMPLNGLGTYSLHGETCVNSVKSALRSGVRLIDTASAYGNEKEVGRAIREAMEELGLKREDIFVITKIYPGSEMADPERSIQACLDRLNIGYVDMMLLHHPDRNDVKAYQAMEKFAEEGKSAPSACPWASWSKAGIPWAAGVIRPSCWGTR